MTEPVTNETLAERIESVIASVNRVARAVEIQNGRVSAIELARAREEGERQAVAEAAAAAAAALALKDKSRTWKVTVGGIAVAAVGVIATLAGVVSQLLVH